MIDTNIKQLVEYGIANELIEEEDRIYTTNTILEMLKKDSYEEPGEVPAIDTPENLRSVSRGFWITQLRMDLSQRIQLFSETCSIRRS